MEKSNELKTPVNIYEHIRNNIKFAPYHGARSSSANSFLGEIGNDVDTASTLIAMLRSQGVRSRYAKAIVRVSEDDAKSWLGVRDLEVAAFVLHNQGIQSVVYNLTDQFLQFEHVWVQAFLPADRYQSAKPASEIDCNLIHSDCVWVGLAPAFKTQKQKDESALVDIYDVVNFNYDAYYNALNEDFQNAGDEIDRRGKNPLEIFEEEILAYLVSNHPGKTLENVADNAEILSENRKLLPESLPFQIISPVQVYDSVQEHDLETIGKVWEKRLRVNSMIKSSIDGGSVEIPLTELSTKRLTYSVFPGLGNDGLQFVASFKLDGQLLGESIVIEEGEIDIGSDVQLTLELDGPPATTVEGEDYIEKAIEGDLIVGGYYVISTGGETSNVSQVRRAARQLFETHQQYSVISDPISSIPYIDTNKNDSIEIETDVLLEEHPEAMDALVGGLLFLAQETYNSRVREARVRLDALNHVISPINGLLGIVSTAHNVEYLDGTPFTVMPMGLLIDMHAAAFLRPRRNSVSGVESSKHLELLGHIASSLEHEVWQEITGFDSISAVRGIQFALRDNADLVDAKNNSLGNTLPNQYGKFGFNGDLPSPWRRVSRDIFHTRMHSFYLDPDDGVTRSVDIFKKEVDTSTLYYRRLGWTLRSDGQIDEFNEYFDNTEEYIRNLPPGNHSLPLPSFCGNQASGDPSQLLGIFENCYTTYLSIIGSDFAAYFDELQGFNHTEYLYRDSTGSENWHSIDLMLRIRDDLYLSDLSLEWVQYLVPSRRSFGPFFLATAYIRKDYDAVSGELLSQAYVIQDESNFTAGGGWVIGENPLDLSDTSEFNNETLSDKSLIGEANNDPIRTPSTLDPISTVTGNMYMDETDFVIKGRGIDYIFTRTYNSGPTEADIGFPMGYGWTHSYNMKLIANDFGQQPNVGENDGVVSSITYVNERGGEAIFGVSGTGPISSWTVTNPRSHFETLNLSQGANQAYSLNFRNGINYVFTGGNLSIPGESARLTAIQDPYGNELLFHYNGTGQLVDITDNLNIAGRTGLHLTYHAAGQLASISDWTGRTWSYGYDPLGNLAFYTNPLGEMTQYEYENPERHELTTVVLPEDRDGDGTGGDVRVSYSYYHNGKAFQNLNSFSHGETVDYDLYRKRTRIEGPRGFIRTHYYDRNGELTKIKQPDGGILFFDHTGEGLRFRKTNGLGFATAYSYCNARTVDGCASDSGGNVTLEMNPLGHTVETDYGIFDQPTRTQDRNGNEHLFLYYDYTDPAGGALFGKLRWQHIADFIGPNQHMRLREYFYNPDGTVREQDEYFDPTDLTRRRYTLFSYEQNGLNVSSLRLLGGGEIIDREFEYDALGRPIIERLLRQTSPTDPTLILIETKYEYDALDRRTKVTDPLGNEFITVYDQNGQIEQQIERYFNASTNSFEPDRIMLRREYDLADRLIKQTDILGNETHFFYDEAGNVTAVTDANGHTTKTEYDSMNRVSANINANGHRSTVVYDLAGRMIKQVDANGNATSFEYDAAGRRTKQTNALGLSTSFQYDPHGNLTHIIDANGMVGDQPLNTFGATEYREYDSLHRLIRVVDALNQETHYSYDMKGNRTSITDAKGQTTTFVYDLLGRLVEVRDPLLQSPDQVTRFSYDQAGNLVSMTDRRGFTTEMHYDALNRLRLREFTANGNTETFEYDHFNDLVEASNNVVTYRYTYDAKHRLLERTDERLGKSLRFEYDPAGLVMEKTDYEGSVTEYQYDSSNRLVALRNPEYVQVSYQYDPAGRLLARTLSSEARSTYAYDAANRLTRLTHFTESGSVLQDRGYGHDRVGNITSISDSSGSTTYSFDALYRLSSADYPGGSSQDESFTYDAVGNRRTYTRGNTSESYQHNANNQLLSIHEGLDPQAGALLASYEYDDNGNTLRKRDGNGSFLWGLIYDQKNRVRVVQTFGGIQSHHYDPFDYRVQVSQSGNTKMYHLENEHIESVYTGEGELEAKFLRGVVIDEIVNGWVKDATGKLDNYTFHHDHLQSVDGVSDHTGAALEERSYYAFGDIRSQTGTSGNFFGYTGRELDPGNAGLYYYRARFYEPSVGRFLSEDPIGFNGGINFYAYVGNNPINANDPMGLADFYWTAGDSSPIIENVSEPGINDFVEGAGGPVSAYGTSFYPAPQDVAQVLGSQSLQAAWPSDVTASMVDGIVINDGNGLEIFEPAWGLHFIEFGVKSFEGNDFDYKHGNPFSHGHFYVFDGQAFSHDYAGNVAWAAVGVSRNIPGILLLTGASVQGEFLSELGVEDPFDQQAIEFGINWESSDTNFSPLYPSDAAWENSVQSGVNGK